MAAHRNDGAAAPGPVTPGNDNASGQAGVEGGKEQAQSVSLNSAQACRRAQLGGRAIAVLLWSVALAISVALGAWA